MRAEVEDFCSGSHLSGVFFSVSATFLKMFQDSVIALDHNNISVVDIYVKLCAI